MYFVKKHLSTDAATIEMCSSAATIPFRSASSRLAAPDHQEGATVNKAATRKAAALAVYRFGMVAFHA
jgi:hypothetical protein